MSVKITLQEAFNLLNKCSAVIIDNDVLVYPSLDEITGDPNNGFMYCAWENEGSDYSISFEEGCNQNITIHENYMALVDTKGEIHSIKPLTAMDLEEELDVVRKAHKKLEEFRKTPLNLS